MAKKLKKAFTITELVIVIAVVAILAAVLIPTFVNIVDKANESSDTQAVREMNLALENAEILEGQPETLTDALEVLADAGMDANAYKALSKGRKFVWDSSINRVLYVTDNNKVLYPQEYKDTIYTFGTWITLTGQMAGDDSWQNTKQTVTNYSLPNEETANGTYTKYTVSTNAQLISFSETMRANEDGTKGANIIIELDADIDLLGAEWVSISEFAGIFNGKGHTISHLTMTDRTQDCVTDFQSTTSNTYRPYGFISVYEGRYFGNVVFDDVKVNSPGEVVSSNHTVAAAIGAVMNYNTERATVIDRVTVKGEVISAYRVAGIVGFAGGTSVKRMTGEIVISNCVNEATITSTLCAATYNTAAGILSVNNQMTETAKLTLEGNINRGSISGQISGGIVGALFGAGAKDENNNYSAGSSGTIIVKGNINEGSVTANHIDGYSPDSTTENGEYIYRVETSARAAGIVSAQTHQEKVYVYNNTNKGKIVVTNEVSNAEKVAEQIAFEATTEDRTSLGYIVGKTETGETAGNTKSGSIEIK